MGNRVSVHFAVTFLDCWRTSFCVTIIKIVNNNTIDKLTSGFSVLGVLALDKIKQLKMTTHNQRRNWSIHKEGGGEDNLVFD